jgi:hypothetical protein
VAEPIAILRKGFGAARANRFGFRESSFDRLADLARLGSVLDGHHDRGAEPGQGFLGTSRHPTIIPHRRDQNRRQHVSTPVPSSVPAFLVRLMQTGDAARLAYWSAAIADLKDAALRKDEEKLCQIVDRIADDGYAAELSEILERIVAIRLIADIALGLAASEERVLAVRKLIPPVSLDELQS